MKYAYEMICPNGVSFFNLQKYKFTIEEMLKACKESQDKVFKEVIEVKFHCEVPNGYHLCSCGNLAKGRKNELCDECKEIYGHDYEEEL